MGIYSFDLRIIMKLLRKKIKEWMNGNSILFYACDVYGWQKDTQNSECNAYSTTKRKHHSISQHWKIIRYFTHNVWIQESSFVRCEVYFEKVKKGDTWFKAVRFHYSVPCHAVSTHGNGIYRHTKIWIYTKVYMCEDEQHCDIR